MLGELEKYNQLLNGYLQSIHEYRGYKRAAQEAEVNYQREVNKYDDASWAFWNTYQKGKHFRNQAAVLSKELQCTGIQKCCDVQCKHFVGQLNSGIKEIKQYVKQLEVELVWIGWKNNFAYDSVEAKEVIDKVAKSLTLLVSIHNKLVQTSLEPLRVESATVIGNLLHCITYLSENPKLSWLEKLRSFFSGRVAQKATLGTEKTLRSQIMKLLEQFGKEIKNQIAALEKPKASWFEKLSTFFSRLKQKLSTFFSKRPLAESEAELASLINKSQAAEQPLDNIQPTFKMKEPLVMLAALKRQRTPLK